MIAKLLNYSNDTSIDNFINPYGKQLKPWLAAALGATVATGTAIANYLSNRSSNAKSFKQQKELLKSEQDYNTDMWNKTNQYNLPTAQMQRLRDAGLNPYLVMSGGNEIGSASSVNSPSAPSSSVTPMDWSSVGSNFQSVLGALNADEIASVQSRKASAEAQGIEIDNQTKALDNLERIKGMQLDNDLKKFEFDFSNETKTLRKQLMDADVSLRNAQWWTEQQKAVSIDLDNQLKKIHLPYAEKQEVATLNEAFARIALLHAQKRLTDKQVKLVVKQILSEEFKAQGLKVDASIKQRTEDYVCNQIAVQSESVQEKYSNLLNYGIEEIPDYTEDLIKGGVDIEGSGLKVDKTRRSYHKRYRRNDESYRITVPKSR